MSTISAVKRISTLGPFISAFNKLIYDLLSLRTDSVTLDRKSAEGAEGGDASYRRYCRYSMFNGQFLCTQELHSQMQEG